MDSLQSQYPLPRQDYMVVVKCFTYNHGKYIEEALKGFVMQKTNFPFCALVVDDFSTDDTAEIIKKYESRYPEIIKGVYLQENYYSQGGIKREKTEIVSPWFERCKYIAMCEGDDCWIDPLKLQKQVDFMEANPDYSLCFHNAIVFNERVEVKERITSFCYFKNDQQISTERLIEDWYIPTASILYRKSCFYQLEYPKFFSGDYTLELALASIGKVYYFDRYMSVYRLNNGGVSSKISVKKWANQLYQMLEWYDNYTNRRYHNEILCRIQEVRKNTRYITLKDKCMLFPVICMPKYTLKMLRNKLSKISFSK